MDTNCSPDSLAVSELLSYSIIKQNWYKLFSWQPGCFSVLFLFNSCSKLIHIALLTVWLLQCSFLIQFLFKIDTNCSPDNLAASVLLSYSILIRNWDKLPSWQPDCFSAPFLFNSYSKLIQIGLLQPGCSSATFLFNYYSKLIRIAPLTAWPLQYSFLIPLLHYMLHYTLHCILHCISQYYQILYYFCQNSRI